MRPEVLTEEIFADWLQHPVTEMLRAVLAAKRQQRKDAWEMGDHLELAKDVQMLQNAAALGECNGFRFVQEMTFEQLTGELDDAREQERPAASRPGGSGPDGGA